MGTAEFGGAIALANIAAGEAGKAGCHIAARFSLHAACFQPRQQHANVGGKSAINVSDVADRGP